MSLRRTGISRRTPLKAKTTLARGGRVSPVSKRRRKRNAGPYAEAKAQVEARADGRCELRTPVCVGVGIEPHHLKGRVGDLLCDVEWMRWTCRPCHEFAESAPREVAYAAGWMASRLAKGDAA